MKGILVVMLICVYLTILGLAVAEMPTFGDPSNPVHNEVARRYIEQGVKETGALNLVSAIIVDYRAFDTLGEVTVLLTAIAALLVVLSQKPGKKKH